MGIKFNCFLTSDIASKNDVRHGINLSLLGIPDATYGFVFYAASGVKKLVKFMHAITLITLACNPSYDFIIIDHIQ